MADAHRRRCAAINALREAYLVTWEPRDSVAAWQERVKRKWRKGEKDSWQREQPLQR